MKTIVVTGSFGGIGSEIVRSFVQNQWNVIAIDIQLQTEILPGATFVQCDLSDGAAVSKLAYDLTQSNPLIHALVNCAAIQNVAPVNELSEASWDQTFAVNVKAPWLLMKGLHPALAAAATETGHAEIVNVSSIHAVATSPGMVAYASSKAALNGLSRSVSIEYAKDAIRINSIIPGAVATPMLVEHLSQAQIDKLLSRQLIPRLIEPAAIVGTIEYLLSPAAANMTGQEITIDSGVLPQLATEMA